METTSVFIYKNCLFTMFLMMQGKVTHSKRRGKDIIYGTFYLRSRKATRKA
jgi:hypothetical protein